MQHVLALLETGRRDIDGVVCFSQHDDTQRLAAFETAAYVTSRPTFLNLSCTFGTVHDGLYGTRAKDNQVKPISACKADRDGEHKPDALSATRCLDSRLVFGFGVAVRQKS